MSDQDKRLNFLNTRLIPIVPQNFDQALAGFREFVAANPNLDRWQYVQVYANSGNYLYFRTPDAKRADVVDIALSVLNEGLQKVEANPDRDPKVQARDIIEISHNKMMVLLAAKRYSEAAKVLDQCWPMAVTSPGNIDNWCRYLREVRTQQGQGKLAVDAMISAFQQRLPWRGESGSDISVPLSDELLSQGRDEEALSWAKMNFMLCNFDEGSIKEATQAVTKILSTRDLSVAKANVFAAAQTDPSAFNPLDEVKLPQLDTTAIKKQLADPDANLSPMVRLISLLVMGDYRAAMVQARSKLVTDVGNQDNARQVARVFKAKDADIARANQFITYYQVGEGENPIPGFLKETSPAPVDPTPKVGG